MKTTHNETHCISNYVQSLRMNLKLYSYETNINILFGALLVHIFIISYMYFFICCLNPKRIKRREDVRGQER